MAKDTYYFSHDFSARNDPKLQMVLRKHGMAGLGAFWCLVELLHEQDGYLMLSQCEDYAFALRADCDLINSLINDFGLFKKDGDKFWSESALERIKERKAKSIKAKESANARWNNANAMRTHSDGNAIKESKGKKIEEKKTAVADNLLPQATHAPKYNDVHEYFYQQGKPEMCDPFFDANEAVGWMKNGDKITNWRAQAAGWIRKGAKKPAATNGKPRPPTYEMKEEDFYTKAEWEKYRQNQASA